MIISNRTKTIWLIVIYLQEDFQMSEKQKMTEGQAYNPYDEELVLLRIKSRTICDLYNSSPQDNPSNRWKIIKRLFGSVGEGSKLNSPFYCDYGFNIHVGKNFYANYNCIFLDVCAIRIGDNVMLGPGVHIYTATHPIDKDERRTKLESGKKVIIGNDVWIGGNSVINPGITIGNNVVVGSCSVVTKDLPSNVVAVGNPCRIIRHLKG